MRASSALWRSLGRVALLLKLVLLASDLHALASSFGLLAGQLGAQLLKLNLLMR